MSSEHRQRLIEGNTGAINSAFQSALGNGSEAKDVVVLVLDVEDQVGLAFAQALAPEMVAGSSQQPGMTRCVVTVIQRSQAMVGFRQLPQLLELLREPPSPDRFTVCCFSRGVEVVGALIPMNQGGRA